MIDIVIYDNDALVLYAPPKGYHYWHPGSPDDCQNLEQIDAHQAIGHLWFPMDDFDVERAPDADSATETVIRDGIVILRIPLENLNSGISETNTVNLSSSHRSTYEPYEWSLRITVTLISSPNKP